MRTQFSCGCEAGGIPSKPVMEEGSNGAFMVIMCSDGEPMTDTVEEFEK